MKVCDKWDHSWIERCWRIVAKDKRCVLWEKAVFADCLNTDIALRNGFEELSEIKDDDALDFSSPDEADISFSMQHILYKKKKNTYYSIPTRKFLFILIIIRFRVYLTISYFRSQCEDEMFASNRGCADIKEDRRMTILKMF